MTFGSFVVNNLFKTIEYIQYPQYYWSDPPIYERIPPILRKRSLSSLPERRVSVVKSGFNPARSTRIIHNPDASNGVGYVHILSFEYSSVHSIAPRCSSYMSRKCSKPHKNIHQAYLALTPPHLGLPREFSLDQEMSRLFLIAPRSLPYLLLQLIPVMHVKATIEFRISLSEMGVFNRSRRV